MSVVRNTVGTMIWVIMSLWSVLSSVMAVVFCELRVGINGTLADS